MSKQRIAKVIARAGVCSRREAERLIEMGRVKVNSEIIGSPALNVDQEDIIKVDEEVIKLAEEVRLWLFYKPCGVITTNYDPNKRKTLFDILPKNLPRVIKIGRLDYNSEGLLLLTNCGQLARKMELPASNLKRKYRCRVYGQVSDAIITKLEAGIIINGIIYRSIIVKVERIIASNTWVSVELTEGKNREIRKVFEYFGLKVNRLIRISYDRFFLNEMKNGEIKEVAAKDVKRLINDLQLKE